MTRQEALGYLEKHEEDYNKAIDIVFYTTCFVGGTLSDFLCHAIGRLLDDGNNRGNDRAYEIDVIMCVAEELGYYTKATH